MVPTEQSRSRQGVVYGIAAYGLWGLIPLYFKSVAAVAPTEVLAHRAWWSFALLAICVYLLGRWDDLWRKLHDGKAAGLLAASGLLMALNWLTFIYAVQSGQVVQASLGYFITPLATVLLGVVLLGERLRPCQIVSLVLAALGMLVLTGLVGRFPWVSLALALTMAFYGLLRKITPVDSLMCVTVETLFMTPVALAYLGYLGVAGKTGGGGLPRVGPLDAQRSGDDRAAVVFRRGHPASAALHDGLHPISDAQPAIPAGGPGLRRALLIAPSAQFRLHLDRHPDLCARLPPRGAAGSHRSGRTRLKRHWG